MLGESSYLLIFLLFIAAAAGAWTSTRISRAFSKTKDTKPRVSPDYFKGVNYLLNEQPDKAIEVFIRMAEVDNETVETHFALGSLFRRRGEVDRAIRIHQNIIARPNLAKKQRDQALFALASDYQKAGLFDRAEKLFLQLSAVTGQRQAAMRRLVSIYEQQKDWTQAIEIRHQLGATSGSPNDGGVAHAYCELAQQSMDKGDLDGARQYLKRARIDGKQLVRSAFMRAAVAEEQQDYKAAIKLCRWIIEHDGSFLVEVLPLMLRCLQASGGDAAVAKTLQSLQKKDPSLNAAFALAALTHQNTTNPVLLEAIRQFIVADPFASKLSAALHSDGKITNSTLTDEQVRQISEILVELIRGRAKYECRECGYSGNVLYWQCPGCKNWDSTRPITRLLVESRRHSS